MSYFDGNREQAGTCRQELFVVSSHSPEADMRIQVARIERSPDNLLQTCQSDSYFENI